MHEFILKCKLESGENGTIKKEAGTGKYKDRQDWNRTREIICTNAVVISVSEQVSARLRSKERWQLPTD